MTYIPKSKRENPGNQGSAGTVGTVVEVADVEALLKFAGKGTMFLIKNFGRCFPEVHGLFWLTEETRKEKLPTGRIAVVCLMPELAVWGRFGEEEEARFPDATVTRGMYLKV